MGSPKHFPASNWCWERELWQEQDKLCRRRTSARGISSQLVSLDCGVNGMKATTRAITSTHVAGNIRIFCILFCNTCFLVLLPAWWAHTHIHIYTHTHSCMQTYVHTLTAEAKLNEPGQATFIDVSISFGKSPIRNRQTLSLFISLYFSPSLLSRLSFAACCCCYWYW